MSAGFTHLPLRRWTLALHVAWSAAVLLLLAWNVVQVKEYMREQAYREIKATLVKGEALADWAIGHGGIYVPAGEANSRDPFLAFLPERDVRTPSGRQLTLVNPATLLGQYYGAVGSEREVRGRLTSLSPINPANRPDSWEESALVRLSEGRSEVVEKTTAPDGRAILRLLKPMRLDDSCTKCHGEHERGTLAGAVSLSIPLDTTYAQREYVALSLGYAVLWFLGTLGINMGSRMLGRRVTQRDEAYRALSVQEHRISAIVKGSLDAILTVDADHFIAGWNPQAEAMFGWLREEALGRPFSDLLAPDVASSRGATRARLVAAAIGERVEVTAMHRNGGRFPVELSIAALDGNDGSAFAVFIRDITEQKTAQEKIRRDYVSQQVIASVLKLSVEPISFQQRLQRSLEIILSTPWLSLQSKGAIFLTAAEGDQLELMASKGLSDAVRNGCDTVPFGDCLCGKAAAERTIVFADQIDHLHDRTFPDMQPHGHYCLPILSGENLLGVLTLYVDEGHQSCEEEQQFLRALSHTLGGMIQRQRAEEQLRHAAFYDELTGLPNRALFMDRLEHALRRLSRRGDRGFAVLYLDLDRFKNINDSLGHGAGDEVLKAVAERLSDCVRPEDTVARLGGDEFTILLEQVESVDGTLGVAGRIHEAMAKPLTVNGNEVFTTSSIGIAMANEGHCGGDDLLREADTAMYQAKRLGTGRTVIFDEYMHHRAIAVLKLETELRRAVERGEFEVHYQPIVSTMDGALRGFEALARWRHPERGLVAPSEFIPLAEETGLIQGIGQSILSQACTQMKDWQVLYTGGPTPYVSVNVSPVQLLQKGFIAQVEETLEATGLSGRQLCLEVTENLLIEEPEAAGRVLTKLRKRGVCLYIDDFGTGYSSLGYLHAFPFDSLKIDRGFINKMTQGEEHSGIVQAVVAMARHLGMNVIAEGVETEEQLRMLRELNCDKVQGFYFSAPLPAAEAERWLMRTQSTGRHCATDK